MVRRPCSVPMNSPTVHATERSTTRQRWRWDRRALGIAAVYLALYIFLEWASYVRPQLAPGITPWNPQAGLTLAFLLLVGPRWWPLTTLAAYLAAVLARPMHVPEPLILMSSLWIGAAYGALARALRHWDVGLPIRTTVTIARMAAIAILGTLLIAVGYVGLFVVAGQVTAVAGLSGIARYWVGDLNGVLPLVPLAIYALDWRQRLRALQRHRWEIVAQFAAVVLMLWITFLLPAADQLRFFYLLFVPIIWIALRWRWPGALLAVLTIQIGLLVVAETRIATARFIDLQFLMLTLTLAGLLLGSVVDERERAAAQLRERDAALARAMRFAVAGELASALAHELNQPITALVSYLRASEILAVGSVGADDRFQATLGKAVREGIRASEVLRRLRDFYQSGTSKAETIHIAALCSAVAEAFDDRARRVDASLTVAIDPTMPTLQADSTQLEIVLHNLVANALDAVADSPQPRRVRIEGSHHAGMLRLSVEDSGPGIAPELAGKAFEPLLTSKADGMGLGLAISRTLIRARGGELSFERSPALGGAAFIVMLPVELP
jgi:two-component system, LuxR family, sensor kinase FixL